MPARAWLRTRRRRLGAAGVIVAMCCATAGVTLADSAQPREPWLVVAGVAQSPCTSRAVPIGPRVKGQFDANSSVLRTAAGVYAAPGRSVSLTSSELACVVAADKADSNWLRSGLVPGTTPALHAMAARALLDLKLAVQPDGAVVAGWAPAWEYAWPRDSSFVAVALADTGHAAMAYQVLRFLQRTQAADGTWASRYHLDGSGPVRDGRPAELDAVGWVPWAVWSWAAAAGPTSLARRELAQLWPMVVRAAGAATRSISGGGGLPEPSMDYWEDSVGVTLGTAAPLLAGLRAAADLADQVRGSAAADGRRWTIAATRLAGAITAKFGRNGYQRTPSGGSGADAAITFLGPPFAVPDAGVRAATRTAQRALTVPSGGLKPGADWHSTPDVAWTAETAMFALFDAATGQSRAATGLLTWLAAHRTAAGSLPEQVSEAGKPTSVAPLAWTDAATLLALLAASGHLPVIPLPAGS